jgi:hypothetical protein
VARPRAPCARARVVAGWPRLRCSHADFRAAHPRRRQPPEHHGLVDLTAVLDQLVDARGYGIRDDDGLLTGAEHAYEHRIALTPLGEAVVAGVRLAFV